MKPGNPAPSSEDPPQLQSDEAILDVKLENLRQLLRGMHAVAVAFSGGIDSALLLGITLETLGRDRVVAYTAQSEISPGQEIEDAARLASAWGAKHIVLHSHDLDDPDFVINSENRCYSCKKRRFSLIGAHARQMGIDCLIHGENVDDDADFRPGSAAARELGARSPLKEAGLDKAEIRSLARRLGIDIWDKPASACLASRIPYGAPITAEKLNQVDRAESFIRGLGITRQLRVRHYGLWARIEADPDAISRLTEPDIRREILEHLKQLGFSCVLLDLEGYRMGSLNPKPRHRHRQSGSVERYTR
jgi:pyridinium-3,5-biscarboxylic acid mononucleotide sulfurtransferase